MSEQVVTRFAPSPTGRLHVGGARTALYNWAYAQKHSGRFILRLEDTDRARSTEEAARSILEDLRWLELGWDGQPVRQSERLAIYNEQIDKLLSSGRAYEDEGAVRLKMGAAAGDIAVPDQVLGRVTTSADQLEDFVIRKRDGYPTYHLAMTIDDAQMGVTHVIRGQEHLSNTPKHWAIREALGLRHPTYAHIPLIFNPDGSKMSKRDKAKVARAAAKVRIQELGSQEPLIEKVLESCAPLEQLNEMRTAASSEPIDAGLIGRFVDNKTDDIDVAMIIAEVLGVHLPEIDVVDFKNAGYLPGPLCNYLALLGWNPGGDFETFDNAFLGEHFDFDRVGKSNAKFDRQKLASFNQQAIGSMDHREFRHHLHAFSSTLANRFLDPDDEAFKQFASMYQSRSKTLADPEKLGAFFFERDDAIDYRADAKALKKVMLKNNGAGFQALETV
ncbi:MAG: glutamate--tRNA ligase family protein, partial [Phycisphaeraceae bacterium]|nr:glutamate--tRNA ligase family protein [Phycisphaeraceae bacterium]